MAKQKFTAIEREAIWIAHEKKCAYTRELIDVSSFHIDHVLPESLDSNPIEFDKVKKLYHLDESFNIFGFENILPCKTSVNLQKGSLLLDPAAFHYYLNIARNKQNEIERNIEKIKERLNKGRSLVLLQSLLESEEISVKQVADLLERHGNDPTEIFNLITGLRFADETEILTISKSDIDQLRDRPIKLGRNTHLQGLNFENSNGDKMLIKTCRDFDRANKLGYYPCCNVDIKLSAFFEHQCGLLSALEVATLASESHIAEPRVGVTDINLLPFSLFDTGDQIIEASPTTSYQELVDKGIMFVRRIKSNLLVIETDWMGQQLVEVARADFNLDGIEDMLLFEYCYATHGTLGYGSIRVLTRKSKDSLFELAALPSEF